jgi:hypothetical protein
MYRVCIDKRNGHHEERSYLMYVDCLYYILKSNSICSLIYDEGKLCHKDDVQSDLELLQGIHNDITEMKGDIRHHSMLLGQ